MATTNQTEKTLSDAPTDDQDEDPRDGLTRTLDDCLLSVEGPLYLDEKIVVADLARDQADRLASEVA